MLTIPSASLTCTRCASALTLSFTVAQQDRPTHGTVYVDIDANGNNEFHLSAHEGEEFIMVLKGTLEINYGKYTYLLEEGDTIYYDSIVPHHVHAFEGQEARILAVIYTPI